MIEVYRDHLKEDGVYTLKTAQLATGAVVVELDNVNVKRLGVFVEVLKYRKKIMEFIRIV